MNLYRLESEDEQDYVEALSFGDAVQAWARDKVREFGTGDESGWHLASEPDSCALVSDHAVIESQQSQEKAARYVFVGLAADRMYDALQKVKDELCSNLCPSVGDTADIDKDGWPHCDKCKAVTAALLQAKQAGVGEAGPNEATP